MARKKVKKSTRTTQKSKALSSSTGTSGWLKHNWLPVLLLAITAAVMLPVAFNDYVSLDDEQFITANTVVQNADVGRALTKQMYSPHYKPLVYLSWIVEATVFGNNPYVMHINNLILHLLNTLLVFFCMLRITRFWEITREHTVEIAFFTALLFGIHPLHVESVAWAIERKDVLFSAFYLSGLLMYLKFVQEKQQKFLFFAALFYMLSLLSKSMGITLIAMTFLIDWASGRRDWKQCLAEKWPLYIPFVIGLFMYGFLYHPKKKRGTGIAEVAEGAVNPPENIAELAGFYQRMVIAAFRYVFFFVHTVIPAKLAIVYPRSQLLAWPGQLIHLAFAGVGVIAALPWIFRKHRNLILTGLLFFTLAIAPILIEEGPGTNFGSDRYTYIPSLGLFLLISTFLLHGLRQKLGSLSLGKVLLALYCLVLGIGAFMQARKWGSSFALYDQAVQNYPKNPVALHYRGGALEDTDPQAALRDYSASIALNDRHYRSVFARGTLYLKMRQYQEAIADFTKTLELNNTYEKAWVNRGNAYRDLGQVDAAIADYDEALKINRRFDKALNNRGAAYIRKGMYQEALADFTQVLKMDPTYVNAYINRAALYINSNVREYEKAIADYDRALQLEPQNVQARYYRGVALHQMGREQEAIQDYDQAIALNPNNGLYHFSKAQALRKTGKREASIRAAKKARELGYDVPADYFQ